MNTLLEIQNEIVFISNAHASKGTIKTKNVDTHWIEEPRVTVCDSEVVQAMNRMKDYKNELETWEKSFFCLGWWSTRLPTGFLMSRGTLDTGPLNKFSPTGVSPSVLYLPRYFD